MNSFEKKLLRRLKRELPDISEVTPGIVIDVHQKGKRKGLLHYGETYDFYDLASLTKIIFTGSACMHYFSDHKKDLKLPISEHLDWSRSKITPAQLMSHTAGLEWWLPMYKSLKGPMKPELRWAQMTRKLKKVKNKARAEAVYSDVDLWMLGAYMEAATELPLLKLWEKTQDRFGVKDLWFHPFNKPKFKRSRFAPTERCPWRHKVLHGEVHDDNTWALAGVAPHAGLFGPIEAVSAWGLELRKARLERSKKFGEPAMVKRFTKRQIPRSIGDFGYLFMKPTKGKASCGKYFDLDSYGHTGFTGTSYWMDPKADLQVVILSNRVHPTRDNKKFLELRPKLHNWVVEAL